VKDGFWLAWSGSPLLASCKQLHSGKYHAANGTSLWIEEPGRLPEIEREGYVRYEHLPLKRTSGHFDKAEALKELPRFGSRAAISLNDAWSQAPGLPFRQPSKRSNSLATTL
jgi:hypothetical protein